MTEQREMRNDKDIENIERGGGNREGRGGRKDGRRETVTVGRRKGTNRKQT